MGIGSTTITSDNTFRAHCYYLTVHSSWATVRYLAYFTSVLLVGRRASTQSETSEPQRVRDLGFFVVSSGLLHLFLASADVGKHDPSRSRLQPHYCQVREFRVRESISVPDGISGSRDTVLLVPEPHRP